MNDPDPRRPGGSVDPNVNDPNAADTRHKQVFRSYLRNGMEDMSPEDKAHLRSLRRTLPDREGRAAQGETDSTLGGYLVPQGFQNELIISLKAYGPMLDPGITRQVETATGNLLPWPNMDDTANQGRRLSENTTVNPVTLAFGVRNLAAYKYTTDVVLVSDELLQDAAIDPEQIVMDAMAVRLGRVVNSELTTYVGGDGPLGIATAALNNYTMASSTAITFDDMIEIEHSLDPLYRDMPGVCWQFADSTLKALRKLKDGEGQYIWQPASVVANAPATILGYKYKVNQAVAAIATTNRSVIFGDHQRYVVRRVKEFMVRRLNERYADVGQVGFIGFARYDGNLMDKKGVVCGQHP